MCEQDREAHRRIDCLHHAHDPLGCNDEAAIADPSLRACAQGDGEILGAAAALQRFGRDESPLKFRTESKELAQPVVLRLERRNACSGESECVAAQLDPFGAQVRGPPALGAFLQADEGRHE